MKMNTIGGALCLGMLFTCFFSAEAVSFSSRLSCPNYDEIADLSGSVADFLEESYQGEWYGIATNEPTEPSFCQCERFTWKIDDKNSSKFSNTLDITCLALGKQEPISIPISGLTARNRSLQGLREEGLPPVAPYIPNMVLFVDKDVEALKAGGYLYTHAVIYSCKEKYLFHSVFESVQIFSRTPNVTESKRQELLDKASVLLGPSFDVNKMRLFDNTQCVYGQSHLFCPQCSKECKCVGGLYNVTGVPEPSCLCKGLKFLQN